MEPDEIPSILDAYAERAAKVRDLGLAVDAIKDKDARALVRSCMAQLIMSMAVPKVEVAKTLPFVKPGKPAS